jgi:ketosteroid isomerase-like protein
MRNAAGATGRQPSVRRGTSLRTARRPARGLVLAGVALVLGCAGAPAPNPAAAPAADSAARSSLVAAQEIAQLHGRWREALASRDTTFLSHTLVDNFQLTGGLVALTKSQFLAAVAADTGGVPPSQFEQTSVRLYGSVAVVTGLIRYDLPGEAAPALSRYTEVWVKEAGAWRAAHLHYNPVPSGQPGNRP